MSDNTTQPVRVAGIAPPEVQTGTYDERLSSPETRAWARLFTRGRAQIFLRAEGPDEDTARETVLGTWAALTAGAAALNAESPATPEPVPPGADGGTGGTDRPAAGAGSLATPPTVTVAQDDYAALVKAVERAHDEIVFLYEEMRDLRPGSYSAPGTIDLLRAAIAAARGTSGDAR